MARNPNPSGFGVKTKSSQPAKSARTKNRQSNKGRARSHVPKSRWTQPSAKKAGSLPPLSYKNGPFPMTVQQYAWRFWAIRGDSSDQVSMTEIQTVTWDDASAVMTGSLTFRNPDWAERIGLREGHEIRAECSDDGGGNFAPLWTMRVEAPTSDLGSRTRTATLANELNRLQQGTDDFVYAKSKTHPNGWRVDEVIRDVCDRYDIEIAYLPVMTARIKNWHLTDQKALDVIHSALIREKNVTGRKYAVSLDWQKRMHVTPFKRPNSLLEVGPQLIAATGSTIHDPRFATALTVRAVPTTKVVKDKKGHRKTITEKIAVSVQSANGVKQYGFIHRNVYSPDAISDAGAKKEGELFLVAVAKSKRSFTVSLPGLPFVNRLDAFKVVLPSEGISQIVYVSDARHNLTGTGGYTTEAVLDFDDPFVDNKALAILNKLSDVAVARKRKPVARPTKKSSKKNVRTNVKKKPSGFGVQTKATRK